MFANLKEDLVNRVKKIDDGQRIAIQQVDWQIFDQLMGEIDFTKKNNTLDCMKLLWEHTYTRILAEWRYELNAKDKEVGRLILEWDSEQRKAKKYKAEVDSLRELLQKEGHEAATGEE